MGEKSYAGGGTGMVFFMHDISDKVRIRALTNITK